MRSITLIVSWLILTASAGAFAQYSDVDPRTLPAQVTRQENIVQSEPGSKDWQAWLKLAVLLQDSGSYGESEDAYLHTVTLLRAPAPLTVADIYDHMGTMYVQAGQLTKAEPVERHALAIREHQHDALGTGISQTHLAMLLLGQNQLHSAEAEAQSAVDILVPEYHHLAAVSSATPEQKMTALIDLALVQSASGADDAALPCLGLALQIARENYSENSLPVGYINFLLGYADWKDGNLKDAEQLMSKGVHTLATEIGWGAPMYLNTLRQYSAFLVQTKQQDRAQEIATEIQRLSRSKNSVVVASRSFATPQTFPK